MLLEEQPTAVGTAEDLRRELSTYANVYQLETSEFLRLLAEDPQSVAYIPDAGFWFQAWRMLERIEAEGGDPPEWVRGAELLQEGSKEPSNLIWTCKHIFGRSRN